MHVGAVEPWQVSGIEGRKKALLCCGRGDAPQHGKPRRELKGLETGVLFIYKEEPWKNRKVCLQHEFPGAGVAVGAALRKAHSNTAKRGKWKNSQAGLIQQAGQKFEPLLSKSARSPPTFL